MCYRGSQEYTCEVSACALLLHPWTAESFDTWLAFSARPLDDLKPTFGSELMIDDWRRVAAQPWAIAAPTERNLEADYELLLQQGYLTVASSWDYEAYRAAVYGGGGWVKVAS